MKKIFNKIGWPLAAQLAQHPVTRSALLMLPVGYLVLWSDALSSLFQFQNQFSTFQFFETETRLILVYYGAICVVVGIVIFELFCPRVCKKYMDNEEYFNSIIQPQNITQLRGAIDRIDIDCRLFLSPNDGRISIMRSEMAPFYSNDRMIDDQALSGAFVSNNQLRQFLSRLLAVHFSSMSKFRLWLSFISIALMLLGIVGVLLPSFEVFVLVLAKTIGILEFLPQAMTVGD